MANSNVIVTINGKEYPLACEAGEEARIEALGARLDAVVSGIVASSGQIGEARLLVMSALMIADELQDLENKKGSPPKDNSKDNSASSIAEQLENFATRLEKLASGASRG